VLIAKPFGTVGAAGGDDLDALGVFVLVDQGVGNDQYQQGFYAADGAPPVLAAFDAVLLGEGGRVRENAGREVERDTVLALVGGGLGRVPGEVQGHSGALPV